MRHFLVVLILLVLVGGAWGTYRVGYMRGFVVAQRIGYQQQVNDALLLLLSRQRILAADPAAVHCEIETLVNSRLALLDVEEQAFQRDISWRDILVGMGEVEEHVKTVTVPSLDQIRTKFNVHDNVLSGC